MARKPRLEFAGAVYHVISRGNYRKALFEEEGSAVAFERTLFEACGKCGWRLHAYVVMSNHYHLALETPEANLVEGMRWLQGTFGIRFNAFHRERGHVFQARYKSLLVEEGRPLLGLVNYIHLNPVRAGMVPLERLRDYRWSSFPKFFSDFAPEPLVRSRFLAALEFPDSAAGMAHYAESLALTEEHDASRHDELARQYCRGWAVATAQYRQAIKERFAEVETLAAWAGPEAVEFRAMKWEQMVERLLATAGKTDADVRRDRKSAAWKVAIARELRAKTTATNAWIACRLEMGHPTRVCNLIRSACKL